MCSGRRPPADRLRLSVERERTAHLPAGDRVIGRHEARQRGSQLVVEPLVRVDAQDPRFLRLIERKLLLQRIAKPWLVNESDREAAANKILDDCGRRICRAGIDNDNLGAVAKAFQAFADTVSLIEADHRCAQAERAAALADSVQLNRRESRGIG